VWNAARLVLAAREGADGPPELPDGATWTLPDRWLLSRHQACLNEVDAAMDGYRFADAAHSVHRFIWSELCDWGLEAAKPRLYGAEEERRAAAGLLTWVLERSLRILHPIMPFVTEEAWQRIGAGESIVIAPWPEPHPEHRDEDAEVRFGFAQELVTTVRRFRKAHALKDSAPLAVSVFPSDRQREIVRELRPEIERLAGISTLEILEAPGDPAGCARLTADGASILIPLADILDPDADRARLAKRMGEIEASLARGEAKLAGEGFIARAPAEVVEKERRKVGALKEEAATLAAQIEELR
jgi:valyl-tRNA synthetase